MRMLGIPGFREYVVVPCAAAEALSGLRADERIASVYDPAVVLGARGRMHRVAYFAIAGLTAREPPTGRTIEGLVESAFGVDKGSARVSVKTASLSLAFDPGRVAFAAIQSILDRKLAAIRLSLLPMRVLEEPNT